MTNEKLQELAKRYKIDLNYYDEVLSYTNLSYTFIYVTFARRENVGGNVHHYNCLELKISISPIMNRGEYVYEYCTDSWEWISDIRDYK